MERSSPPLLVAARGAVLQASWDPQIQTDPGRRDILTTFNRGYPRPWPIEER
jgi:hypothetical protein